MSQLDLHTDVVHEGKVTIQNVAANPAHSPAETGRIIYNTTVNKYYVSTNSEWVEIQVGTGGINIFDAVVDAAGNGDYTTLASACAGESEGAFIYIKNGSYSEVTDVVIKNGQKIYGESMTGVIINPSNQIYVRDTTVKVNTGSVSVATDSTTVTGTATTFVSDGLTTGHYIVIDGYVHEIASVTGELALELTKQYEGQALTTQDYLAGDFASDVEVRNLTIDGGGAPTVVTNEGLIGTSKTDGGLVNSTFDNIKCINSNQYAFGLFYVYGCVFSNLIANNNANGIWFDNFSTSDNIASGCYLGINQANNNNGMGLFIGCIASFSIDAREISFNGSYGVRINQTGIALTDRSSTIRIDACNSNDLDGINSTGQAALIKLIVNECRLNGQNGIYLFNGGYMSVDVDRCIDNSGSNDFWNANTPDCNLIVRREIGVIYLAAGQNNINILGNCSSLTFDSGDNDIYGGTITTLTANATVTTASRIHNCTITTATINGDNCKFFGCNITAPSVAATATGTEFIGCKLPNSFTNLEGTTLVKPGNLPVNTNTVIGTVSLNAIQTGQVFNADVAGLTQYDLPASCPLGTHYYFSKTNSGSVLRIDAPTGQYIADSVSSGNIENSESIDYAAIHLIKIRSTMWAIFGAHGTWVTT